MFQVVSIGTNSGRQRFRLFRRPISRRRAGPMHRGRRRGPSGGNTTNRRAKEALPTFVGDLKYGLLPSTLHFCCFKRRLETRSMRLSSREPSERSAMLTGRPQGLGTSTGSRSAVGSAAIPCWVAARCVPNEAVRTRNRCMASKVRCEHLSCTLLRCPHPAPLHTRLEPAVEQRVRYSSSPTAPDISLPSASADV